MDAICEIIRKKGADLCDKLKEMFLKGDCDNLTIQDIETLKHIANPVKYYSCEDAKYYLGLSNSKFYLYRRAKIIPPPVKIKGFPKPVYTKMMLDKVIENVKKFSEKELFKIARKRGITW